MARKKSWNWYNLEEVCQNIQQARENGADSLKAIRQQTGYSSYVIETYPKKMKSIHRKSRKGMGHKKHDAEKVFSDVQQAIAQGANSLSAIRRMTEAHYSCGTIKKYCAARIILPIGKIGYPKGMKRGVKRIESRDELLKDGRLSLEQVAEKEGITRQGVYDYLKRTGLYDAWRQEREKYYKFRGE